VSSCKSARCTHRRVESRTARAETLRCSRMHARADADRPHWPGHFPAPTSARPKHKPSRSARFKKSLPFYFRNQRFPFTTGAARCLRLAPGFYRYAVDRRPGGSDGCKAMSLLGPTASLFKGRGGAPPAPVRAHALNMSPRTILDAV
jgi:hypothetical protein